MNIYTITCLVFLVNFIYGNVQNSCKCKIVSVMRLNSSKCEDMNSTWNCPTLQHALALKDLNFTYIRIFTTTEELVKPYVLANINHLTIASTNNTSVKCFESKLSFVGSANITIHGLRFEFCGVTGQDDFVTVNNTNIHLSSSLYFRNVSSLVISDTTFQWSAGYSVIMVDVLNIYYWKVYAYYNKLVPFMGQEKLAYGGGILTLLTEGKSSAFNTFRFLDCYFYFNNATKTSTVHYSFLLNHSKQEDDFITNLFTKTFFGNGGALSFYLQNRYMSTNIFIKSCHIYHNRAFWGGGIYLEFGESCLRSQIEISDTQLVDNFAKFSGGGIRIIRNTKHRRPLMQQNIVYINHSLFNDNEAEVGGGLAQIYGLQLLESEVKKIQETVIVYCEFQQNKGRLGSAIYLDSTSALLHMVNITRNTVLTYSDKITSGPSQSTVMGVGALYSYKSHVVVNGTATVPTKVLGNLNTAFVLDYSYLFVLGTVIFEENQGSKGGAISMYEESVIFLFDTTYLFFNKNKGIKGGAMYVYVTGPPIPLWNSTVLLLYNCFFQYRNVLEEKFKGSVIFKDNEAAKNVGNAIFANMLQNCQNSNWKKFDFIGNSSSFITTDPVNITVNQTQWNKIQPGIQFSVNIYIRDERGQYVDAPIDINFESKDKVFIKNNKNRMIVTENTVDLVILGDRNAIFSVIINTPLGRALPKKIFNKSLSDCAFAYSYSDVTKSCECLSIKNQDRMISRCIGKDIYLYKQVWAFPYQRAIHNDHETTQVCPPGYCNHSCSSDKDTVDCKYDPHYQCAKNRNQSPYNYLCARCLSNYSVLLGSEDCRDCRGQSEWWKGIIILFFVIPVIVVGILVLKVDVYEHYLNSLIFFYQVAHLFLMPAQKTDIIMKVIMEWIDFRGFGVEGAAFCLIDALNDLDKLMINYTIPFFMIVTLGLVILFVKYCSCCHSEQENVNRNAQINHTWACTLSLGQAKTFRAILFILVLAYSAVTRITLSILKPVEIDGKKRVGNFAVIEFKHGKHFAYTIVASIISVLFVLGVPVLLIIPTALTACGLKSFKIKNQSNFMKRTLENLYGVYKGNIWCHLFSSYYFFFRLFLLIMNTFCKPDQFQLTAMAFLCFVMVLMFVKVKPYGNDYYNYFDMFVLVDLTVVAFLCNGKLQVPVPNYRKILDYVYNVLLWLPLIVWIIVLCVKYRQMINEKMSAVFTRLHGGLMQFRRT